MSGSREFALLLALPLLLAAFTIPFVRPTAAQRAAALGPLEGESAPVRRAFDTRGFQPVKMPGLLDWLANHEEPGQRVDQFIRQRPNLPNSPRRRIYLVPLGDLEHSGGPPVARLVEFSRAFFGLEVGVLPALDLRGAKVKRRRHPIAHNEQILTTDVLALLKTKLPADAYALLGVTMEDLYPADDWNYVFGQASLRERVGVYSFVRYDPKFFGEKRADSAQLMLRRSCHILAHETGHMFGIAHCTWYQCVMNGADNLQEFDGQPLHLCPVDLRKLQWSAGFDIAERYRRLMAFYAATGLTDEAAWLQTRLKMIEGK